jgi:hypothetical protein
MLAHLIGFYRGNIPKILAEASGFTMRSSLEMGPFGTALNDTVARFGATI